MSLDGIRIAYHYKGKQSNEPTLRQRVALGIGCSTICIIGLAAIGAGVLALTAMGGADLWVFNALGSVGKIAAWGLAAGGSSIILAVAVVLLMKYIKHYNHLRERLLKDQKNFEAIFEHLKTQQVWNDQKMCSIQKVCCIWNSETGNGQQVTYVFRLAGKKRSCDAFTVEGRERQKYEGLLKEWQLNQGFTLVDPPLFLYEGLNLDVNWAKGLDAKEKFTNALPEIKTQLLKLQKIHQKDNNLCSHTTWSKDGLSYLLVYQGFLKKKFSILIFDSQYLNPLLDKLEELKNEKRFY